ncbi:Uncharacterised protein [uncultured archaeon]|nr:Uncharacterised protein [uncultured archaeon]
MISWCTWINVKSYSCNNCQRKEKSKGKSRQNVWGVDYLIPSGLLLLLLLFIGILILPLMREPLLLAYDDPATLGFLH